MCQLLSESGARNESLGTGAAPAGSSTHGDEAGNAYGPSETYRKTEVGSESGRGMIGSVRAVQSDQEGSPPSLTFVALLVLILDVIGLVQSPRAGSENGSTRFRWMYYVSYDASVIATVLSAVAVVMLLFAGTSLFGGRFKTPVLLSVSLAAFSTALAFLCTVFSTWGQLARPALHMSFVVVVVAGAISASYWHRFGKLWRLSRS